jgi:hypothetical protein
MPSRKRFVSSIVNDGRGTSAYSGYQAGGFGCANVYGGTYSSGVYRAS